MRTRVLVLVLLVSGLPATSVPAQEAAPVAPPSKLEIASALRAGEPGVQMPRVLRDVKPQYSARALKAGIQGTVLLDLLVDADGTVADVRVVRSLDPDLDANAVSAARGWRFAPATRGGVPVPVLVTVEMAFALKSPAGAAAQTPSPSPDEQFLFIDTLSATSKWTGTTNFSTLGDRLADAGSRGYGLGFIARASSSVNMLLKRDGQGPRTYRLIAEGREGSFLKELNQAGSQGFRLLPDTIRVLERGYQAAWVAVMQQSGAARFTYSVVKGRDDGERALAESGATGKVLRGILGRTGMMAANSLLFFEQAEHPTDAPAASSRLDYRILATVLTSKMQTELGQAATAHFRVVGAGVGYMTVVMARDPGSTPEPIDYRLVAMIRAQTAIKELSAAGADGFRIAATSQNGTEAVFILHRRPDTSERFEYGLLSLQEATADRLLRQAEADGYRVVTLLNELVVLERPSAASADSPLLRQSWAHR